MKKLILLFFVGGGLLSATIGLEVCKAQVTDVIQTLTSGGDYEGINATTTILKISSMPIGLSTLNLSSAASTGRRLTIINYSSIDIPLSPVIRVDGGVTALIATISKSPNIMNPLAAGVTITITYDGTNWIKI